jgi:hypothetical protein
MDRKYHDTSDRRLGLSGSIDQEGCSGFEEGTKYGIRFWWKLDFVQSGAHQLDPSIASSLVYGKRRMPHAKPRMSALLNVSCRAAKAVNEKAAEALFSAGEIPSPIDWPENVVGRDAPVKGGNETVEAVLADRGIYFVLLHERDRSTRSLVRSIVLGRSSFRRKFGDWGNIGFRRSSFRRMGRIGGCGKRDSTGSGAIVLCAEAQSLEAQRVNLSIVIYLLVSLEVFKRRYRIVFPFTVDLTGEIAPIGKRLLDLAITFGVGMKLVAGGDVSRSALSFF